MEQLRKHLAGLEKFKVPLLVLIVGVLLMLVPGTDRTREPEAGADALLQQTLSCSEGVGELRVIVSENGVVVICRGADNAKVRLDLIKAIGAYTGFGSDKITILKMAD